MRIVASDKSNEVSFNDLKQGDQFRFYANDVVFMRIWPANTYVSLETGAVFTKTDIFEKVTRVTGAYVEDYQEDDVPF